MSRTLGMLMMVFGLLITANRFMFAIVDAPPSEGLPWESPLQQIVGQLQSPVMGVMGLLGIILGGWLTVFGSGFVTSIAAEPEAAPRPVRRPPAQIGMTLEARQAKAAVDGLIARFRSMPDDAVSPEARIEFDAITGKHLPDLEEAHGDARKAAPATGPEADSIDGDYTAGLDRLAATLGQLVHACATRARSDLTVQNRFIELRHPVASDPLSSIEESRS